MSDYSDDQDVSFSDDNYLYDDDDEIIISDSDAEDQSGKSDSSVEAMTPEKGKMFDPLSAGHMQTIGDTYAVKYKVISPAELTAEQDRIIYEVSEMLGFRESDAALLLRYFEWNKDKLLERYTEDPESVAANAGISEGSSQPRLKRVRGFTCGICYVEDDNVETLALSCNHRFCKDCYSLYVTNKITQEGESRRIQCMEQDCVAIVDEKTMELLVDPKVFLRYKSLLDDTYVDDSQYLKWCPGPDCNYVIYCPVSQRQLGTTIPTVRCHCRTTFCFGCMELGDHRPCCCEIVKRWAVKCKDDSETSHWISAHTKECPKCFSTIEKNGGCNHMTCKKCKYEFCWICMGLWRDHGTSYYNCSRYDDKNKGDTNDGSDSRKSLERYLHYYNRFANHEQSIKLENQLYDRTQKKMEEMQQSTDLSWIEVQFLEKAVETLGKCRTVLKWTYAMAFYLNKDSNHTFLFEDNQSDLEFAVESLSELIEKPLVETQINTFRQQITDKTAYVAKRCQIVLDDTLAGYEEDRWSWTDPLKY